MPTHTHTPYFILCMKKLHSEQKIKNCNNVFFLLAVLTSVLTYFITCSKFFITVLYYYCVVKLFNKFRRYVTAASIFTEMPARNVHKIPLFQMVKGLHLQRLSSLPTTKSTFTLQATFIHSHILIHQWWQAGAVITINVGCSILPKNTLIVVSPLSLLSNYLVFMICKIAPL